MDSLQHLFGVTTLITELALLGLQVWAFRRFKHYSFLLLAIGTVTGLLYFGLSEAPYIYPAFANNYQVLLVLAAGFFVVQGVFGVWGTLALFRAYGALAHTLSAGRV